MAILQDVEFRITCARRHCPPQHDYKSSWPVSGLMSGNYPVCRFSGNFPSHANCYSSAQWDANLPELNHRCGGSAGLVDYENIENVRIIDKIFSS